MSNPSPSRSAGSRIVKAMVIASLSHAVALGKRKASEAFASSSMHTQELTSPSTSSNEEDDSEYEEDVEEEGVAGDFEDAVEDLTDRDSLPPGSATPSERKYRCTHQGCIKSYSKPSRLAEHERSHTGDRPYVCSSCHKSYLRESHLQAHSRTHLPESGRPFMCHEEACTKRFWTAQHLNVHVAGVHRGEKAFSCTEEACKEAFAKHNQLRRHVAEAHCPPGTKPFRCDIEGCTKSFATNQKLRKHSKVHQDNRYACVNAKCAIRSTSGSSSPLYFPTWTALQGHIREHHPPTCPYPECGGRTFTSQKGLKPHLKLHQERELEEALNNAAGVGGRPRKRRRGGELGRDWACDVEGCAKRFKSKKALATHHNVTHLGRRDHVCLYPKCGQTFGYKHLLQRHVAKMHSTTSNSARTDDEESSSTSNIDWITGKSYTSPSAHRNTRRALVPCPWQDSFQNQTASGPEDMQTGLGACAYVFSRAYDLRRHLKADHGLGLSKEEMDAWVRDWRERHPEGNQTSLID